MNDFTKEDLEDLECWLRVTRKQDITLPSNKDLQCLQDKIQSKIDNYCTHKHIVQCADCDTIRCMTCGRRRREIEVYEHE